MKVFQHFFYISRTCVRSIGSIVVFIPREIKIFGVSKSISHIYIYIYIYIYICDMLFETPKILISLGMKTTILPILLTHVLEI